MTRTIFAILVLVLALCGHDGVRAQTPTQPIPILQSDAEEYRAGINLYQEALLHLQKVRYHACLAAQVTEEECWQPDLQGRGFVARLPKRDGPKGEQ